MTPALPTTDFGVDIPFVKHLGLVLTVLGGGESEITFEPQPEYLNSFGVTHGGIVMTLLDVAMAMAARSDLDSPGVVTIEMKTSFMRPSLGPLKARGHILHRTATLAFAQGTVQDEHGKVCAYASGTFKYVRRLATGHRSVHHLGGIPVPPADV